MKSTIEHKVRLAQIRDTVNRDKASIIVVQEDTTAEQFLHDLIDQSYLYPRNSDLKRQPYLIVTHNQIMLLVADLKVFDSDKMQYNNLVAALEARGAKLMTDKDMITQDEIELASQENPNVQQAYLEAEEGTSLSEIEAKFGVRWNYETGRFVVATTSEANQTESENTSTKEDERR